MNNCKNCKNWKATDDDFNKTFYGKNTGVCFSDKFVYITGEDKCPVDGLGYLDSESYSAEFVTGENFGCIHHQPK